MPSYKDLQGNCDKATHVISALVVGAFDFYAGSESQSGAGLSVAGVGAGAKQSSSRRTINQAGEEAACMRSTTRDPAPPEGCGVPLRVEVMPIPDAPAFAPPPSDKQVAVSTATAPATTGAATSRWVASGAAMRDSQTGLMWQRDFASPMTYDQAESYCLGLRISIRALADRGNLLGAMQDDSAPPSGSGRASGWRIPSLGELATLKGIDSSMRGAFWATDSGSAMNGRPFLTGNLLGQAAATPRAYMEFPLGLAHRNQDPYDKHSVRCVK